MKPQRVLYSSVIVASLIVSSPFSVFADTEEVQTVFQSSTIRGTVVDANGIPVIGASVLVKGTSNGTITDIDGNFTLQNTSGTLVVSYIGYKTQEVSIQNQKVFNIVLKEDTEVLDEVVVVGYGVQKKQLFQVL